MCATQRSGSTLLCRLLEDTGVAGNPREYFEARAATGRPPAPGEFVPPAIARGLVGGRAEAFAYSSLVGLPDYRAHLQRTWRDGTTANGVFAAKLMFDQLGELETLAGGLAEYRGLAGTDLLRALLGDPMYVLVSRADKVRQAVSLWRALQDGRWRGGGDGVRVGELRYSFAAIDHLAARLTAQDDGWRRLLSRGGIDCLRIGYEDDLERDRDATVRAVLARLGVSAPPGWSAGEPLVRQADALSEEWVAAYDRDRARRGGSAPS